MQDLPQKQTLADKLQPQSLEDLIGFAERIIESKLCPDHFDDASDIVLVAQQGVELGLNVMTALQNSHVIHGQVGWDADLLKALCLETGEVERWHYEEKSGTRCAAVVQRRRFDAETFEWTKERAEYAGLWGKGVWQAHPGTMLRHRVDAEAARAVFPDVVAGVHTPNELREATSSPEPTDAELVDETDTPQIAPDDAQGLDAALDQEPADDEPKVDPGETRSVHDLEDDESDDVEPDSGPDQADDAPSLTSLHNSIGQLVRASSLSDDEKRAHREMLERSGLWGDATALANYRDDLRDATDRAAFVRDRIDAYDEADSGGDADNDEDGTDPALRRLYALLDKASVSDKMKSRVADAIADAERRDDIRDVPSGALESWIVEIEDQSPEPRTDGPPERAQWAIDLVQDGDDEVRG